MTLAIAAGFIAILAGQKPIGKGLILGAIFGVVNFVLMGETLPMKLGHTKSKATAIALGSIFFRYALLAVPIVLAVKYDLFNLFSVVLGIFLIQLVILADHFSQHIRFARGKS